MNLPKQPKASFSEMLNGCTPEVQELHRQYRQVLDNIVKDENEQRPTEDQRPA